MRTFRIKIYDLILALIIVPVTLFGQQEVEIKQWTELINDPKPNFFEIREAYHQEFANRPQQSTGIWCHSIGTSYWGQVRSGCFRDLAFKPGDPNTIYALTTNQFWRSMDGGNSWSQITSGLPLNAGRLVLAVSPADPNTVITGCMYPNPNDGNEITISVPRGVPGQRISIAFHDITGKLIYAEEFSGNKGQLHQTIRLTGRLIQGIYLVTISNIGKSKTQRLLIHQRSHFRRACSKAFI